MGDFRGLYFLASYSYRQESIAKTARTGCRGGTPSWGRNPHTPLKPSALRTQPIIHQDLDV
jgi:hypothetical protein